jgi:hypothetical protein
MTFSKEISFEGDHIRAVSIGEKSIDTSRELWSAIVQACEEHQCFRVLGIAHTTKAMPIIDGFDHVALFRELGINTKFRIAWVEQNPGAMKSIKFIDAALFNRMLPGRIFSGENAAKTWLFSSKGY